LANSPGTLKEATKTPINEDRKMNSGDAKGNPIPPVCGEATSM
jgi:hypothetical protein